MKTKKYTALSFVVILLVSAFTSCGNVPNIQNASSNHDANFVELDDATKKTTAVIEGLYEEVPFDYSEQYQFFGDIKKANDDLFILQMAVDKGDEPHLNEVMTDSSFSDFVVVDFDTPEEIAEKENSAPEYYYTYIIFCEDGSFNVIWAFCDPETDIEMVHDHNYPDPYEYYIGHYDINGVLENLVSPETVDMRFSDHSIAYGKFIYMDVRDKLIKIDTTDGSVSTICEYNPENDNTGKELVDFKRDNEGKPLAVLREYDTYSSNTDTYVYDIADCESLPEPLCCYSKRYVYIYDGYSEYKYLKCISSDSGDKLYGVRADGTEQLIIDWEFSGLSYRYFCPVGNDEFVALKDTESSINGQLIKLVKKDASSIENMKFLTVCDYFKNFNKINNSYNTSQNSYHVSPFYIANENYTDEEFVDRLDEKISSGDWPDIIIFNNRWEMYRYADQGLIADMGEIMDNDPEYCRDAYVPNLLEMFTEPDNKIYGLPLDFSFQTLAVKPKYWDKPSWTLDEMISAFDENEDNMCYIYQTYQRQRVLLELIANNEHLIDYQNRTCNFNSPEFIKILEFSNRFYDEKTYNNINEQVDFQHFGLDRSLVEETLEGNSYCWIKYVLGLGDDISLVGYPSDSGNGGRLRVNYIAAISESCTDKEGAYEYIKYLVSENDRGFISSLTERFEEDAYRDVGQEYIFSDNEVQPLSMEEADMLKKEMLSCHSLRDMLGYNFEELIIAEAERYFNGEISSDEAAENIQMISEKFM